MSLYKFLKKKMTTDCTCPKINIIKKKKREFISVISGNMVSVLLRFTDSHYPFGIFKLLNQVMVATVKLSKWWSNYGVLDQLRDIYSICMWCYIQMESSQWKNLNHPFCRYVSFLTGPHCQLRRVGQDMKET
jgi:hypothetical protein